MNNVTGSMYVEDIVSNYPESVGYLMEREIICIRCGAPVWGTLDELLESKGVKDKNGFISELNSFLEKKES